MNVNKPSISKEFLLNPAVEDALRILFRPYVSSESLDGSNSNIRISFWKNEGGYWTNHEERLESSGKHFFMRMAMIAWDFLNISNVFQKS